MDVSRTMSTYERGVLYQAADEINSLSLIQELANILIDHEDDRSSDDEVSSVLWTRGYEFVHFVSLYRSISPNKLQADIISRIEKMKQALLCEFTDTILWDPWYAEGMVWEKFVLDQYQEALILAEKAPVVGLPCVFAKKIITWLTAYPLESELRMVPYEGSNELIPLGEFIGRMNHIRMKRVVREGIRDLANMREATTDSETAIGTEAARQQRMLEEMRKENLYDNCHMM